MKKIIAVLLILCGVMAFTTSEKTTYKCMIQMTNYEGEGAYIVISLLNPEGAYEQTLYVQGDDEEWYHDIDEWWKFQGKVRSDIDAITGATISGGNRAISLIEIPNDKIDKGYKIRFETAVEDQEYYADDVQFELTSESVKSKVKGKGFIRYIRLIPQ
ncbi:Flagellin biosynthesis protein FlgD [Tenacibaculum sp. 190130A14a]|uniref:Flagellin biosynthesis protein FlgD n=2 Tax=Tenacibaculum polynesiense TaxID=3137857 RepID=A0ABP1F1W2_9FLAO